MEKDYVRRRGQSDGVKSIASKSDRCLGNYLKCLVHFGFNFEGARYHVMNRGIARQKIFMRTRKIQKEVDEIVRNEY